jgi:hypothetical protein
VTIAWEATGAAADMDICLKFIDPSGVSQSTFKHAPKDGNNVAVGANSSDYGTWTIRVSGLFEGDTCSATVDNFCSECDNPRSERNFILEAPQPEVVTCDTIALQGEEWRSGGCFVDGAADTVLNACWSGCIRGDCSPTSCGDNGCWRVGRPAGMSTQPLFGKWMAAMARVQEDRCASDSFNCDDRYLCTN